MPTAKKMTKAAMKAACIHLNFEPYTSRPGPPYSAPGCVAKGLSRKRGRDGMMYTAIPHGKSYVWRKPLGKSQLSRMQASKASKPKKAAALAPPKPPKTKPLISND